ncbi:MAG: hypothetical protein ABMA14_02845 [Hyphomonadaceae bacterium]
MRHQLMLIGTGFASALIAVVWICCSPQSVAQERDCTDRLEAPRETEIGRPVLVLFDADPWLMVMGSDSPRFALYDDGLLIFRTGASYKQTRLAAAQVKAIRDSVRVGALSCHIGFYEVSHSTDQPTETIFVGRGGGLAQISVYGSLKGEEARKKIPGPVVEAYDRLSAYSNANAQDWLPANIEVMAWPYEYAPEPSIVWPKKWPGLRSPEAVSRGDGYSLFVPSADYNELVAFLKTQREKGAVEIEGKKWAVSLRLPFPQESSWMR